MNLSSSTIGILLILFNSLLIIVAATVDRPKFTAIARVKQHFHKTGGLIKGEEHLLKVIIKWEAITGADAYELCHNCDHISEVTGAENGNVNDGTIYLIEIGGRNVCGGQPCHVIPGAPMGNNKFHLRVIKDGELSPWSNYQNFNVQEPGNFDHEEL
jgi:hypothetical protein